MTKHLPLIALILATPALAAAQPPRVLTDSTVTASLVAQVMGDIGAPVSLLDADANVHDFQLRPSQARELERAELLVWVGPELTPWLSRQAEILADRSMPLLALKQTHTRSYGGEDAHDGHDHEHEHEHEHQEAGHDHDHEEEGHTHTGADPHAWLDPANAAYWVGEIAARLGTLDPENSAEYQMNAAEAKKRIAAMDADIAGQIAPVKDASIVVAHDAYGYFTDHYGMKPAMAVSAGDSSAPAASRLRTLQDQIKSSGATCAFPDANHSTDLMKTATEGTGVKMGAALSPEGAGLAAGPNQYDELMRGIAKSIVACAGK